MNRRDTTQYQYEENRRNKLGEDKSRYQRDRSHRSHSWRNNHTQQKENTRKGNYVEVNDANDKSVCFMGDRNKVNHDTGNDTILFFID